MKVFIVKNKIIYLIPTNSGWYIEVNDGYTSEYFSSKKNAMERVAEIKKEIKNNTW